MKKETCLFVVNGLGLGNATRCHAVIQHLHNAGIEVHVLTFGNGLIYFKNCPQITSLHTMEGFNYGSKNGRLSLWKTIASLKDLYRKFKEKGKALEVLLDSLQPDVVVSDSEYSIFPVKKRKIPLIGLNNSDAVVHAYFEKKSKPASIRAQFWFVEFMDYLYHQLFFDVIISPYPVRLVTLSKKIRRVGVIVRQKILDALKKPELSSVLKNETTAVFVLSGSTFASQIDFSDNELPCRLHIVGRTGNNFNNVRYFGKEVDNTGNLLSADVLVVNGGFSAVSEALVLNRPTLVMPVPNHAEQYLNACLLEEFGRGKFSREDEVLDKLEEILRAGIPPHIPGIPSHINADGAREAADIISALARSRSKSQQKVVKASEQLQSEEEVLTASR